MPHANLLNFVMPTYATMHAKSNRWDVFVEL